jgi:antitoxin HigA-1
MPTTSAARTTTRPASLTRDSAVLGPMIHPGEMLLEEFLRPLGLQQSVVAGELGISRNRLNELILGKRSVTADRHSSRTTIQDARTLLAALAG